MCFSPSLSLSDDSLPCPVLAVFCVFCGVLASAFASASPTTTPTAAAQPASREVGHIQRQSAKPGAGRCSTSIILFHCSPLCCPHEEHAHLSLLHIPYYSLCSASFFPCMPCSGSRFRACRFFKLRPCLPSCLIIDYSTLLVLHPARTSRSVFEPISPS